MGKHAQWVSYGLVTLVAIVVAVIQANENREALSRVRQAANALDEQRDQIETLSKELDRARWQLSVHETTAPRAVEPLIAAPSGEPTLTVEGPEPTLLVHQDDRAEVEPGGPMAPIAQ